MDPRIGAQYYTIKDFCQTLEDFDSSCKKVSEIGYQTVQLSGIGDFSAGDIKRILDKYHLEAVCTHRPAQNYLEDIEKEIEFHKTIGCPVCGLGIIPGYNVKEETVEAFIRDFTPICRKLAEHGLVFAYHNHALEFEKRDGKFIIDILTEGIKSDNFKFILDAYWLAYAGVNPAKFIREYKEKIACVHLKDLKIIDGTPCFAEVGQGNIDWDDVIAACEEADVLYALVEQDTCEGDPFACLKTSYRFLKEKGFE